MNMYHSPDKEDLLSGCCLTPNQQFISYYHGENKLILNEIMMRSDLYWTNTSSWILTVLAHWNNSPRIDMSPHSDTLSRFRTNSSLRFFLNAACLAEKQQIPILYSFVWPNWGSHPQSTTLEANTLTITPSMRLGFIELLHIVAYVKNLSPWTLTQIDTGVFIDTNGIFISQFSAFLFLLLTKIYILFSLCNLF